MRERMRDRRDLRAPAGLGRVLHFSCLLLDTSVEPTFYVTIQLAFGVLHAPIEHMCKFAAAADSCTAATAATAAAAWAEAAAEAVLAATSP